MKIAIISSGFLPVVDGVTVALYQRLRVLSELNYQVLVLCPDYQPVASAYPDWQDYQGEIFPGVEIVSLPSESFLGVEFERNLSRKAHLCLQRKLETFKPDIIHVDEPDRLFMGLLKAPGVAYAKASGISCIGFYHTHFIDYIEDFLPLPPWLIPLIQWGAMLIMRPVFHAYDVILVSSPVTEQRLHQLGVRNVLCDRFLGVDVKTFQAQSPDLDFFQHEYGLEHLSDKIKLVFLGRLTPDKGWKFTLSAFAAWVQNPHNAPWLNRIAIIIAGAGDLQAEIETALQALGLSVYCLGRIAPSAVPSLLANSDIHITTSEKETLGLTILEAFAAGIPAIAPNAGGVVTHIRDRQNGLLFQPQDINSFGQALSSLLSDAPWRQKLGQQGQQDVNNYRWESVTHNLINLWKTQISLKSPP